MEVNVLSLFDGISCGQIALERAGIKVSNYFASEIDKYAIQVTKHNYPNTKHIGDVCNVKSSDLPNIDLLIGGSPCQGFSTSGKNLNFDDPRSKLFFEYIRLLKECKPKYWLLENVVMKKEIRQVITRFLEVEPVKINSALVSAQNRERLYWANFPIEQPNDRGIKLVNILEDTEMFRPSAIRGRKLNNKGNQEANNIQCLEVKSRNTDKSNCLTTVAKDNVLTAMPIGKYPNVYKNKIPFRYYTIKEYCRLQTVPEKYFDNIESENQIKKMIGNSWTVDVIEHIFKEMLKENAKNEYKLDKSNEV